MGVLNVTPDSFSDGGRFAGVEAAIAEAREMAANGAAIIDIGGESTRPGADPVDAPTEQRRILPVIEALRGTEMILSVDSWRAETARRAIDAGAHIVNDVWGFQKDREIAAVAAATGAGCVIMHTGREREKLADPLADQTLFLSRSLEIATGAGIALDQIVLDPGFGFAKDTEENVEVLARLEELHAFGQPLLTGTSRKRFIGAVSGREPGARDVATAATTVIARLKGGAVFRVHDVPKNRDALAIADAVIAARREPQEPTAREG